MDVMDTEYEAEPVPNPNIPEDETVELVVPSAPQAYQRIICLPVDQSPSSAQGVTWALKTSNPESEWAGIDLEHKDTSHALLIHFATLAKSEGFNVKAYSLRGDVRPMLTSFLNEMRPHAVVMARSGRMMGSLGSVSEHLIHNALCPILLSQ